MSNCAGTSKAFGKEHNLSNNKKLFPVRGLGMEKINIIHSRFYPLPIENVDTDQIIPARFLKATTRDGFGKNLFRDWRYIDNDDCKPKPDFVLNKPEYSGQILVAGKNFGSGSSREHAAWALLDFGFKIIVSRIFYFLLFTFYFRTLQSPLSH